MDWSRIVPQDMENMEKDFPGFLLPVLSPEMEIMENGFSHSFGLPVVSTIVEGMEKWISPVFMPPVHEPFVRAAL